MSIQNIRRIAIILGFIAFVVLIAWFIYVLFFRSTDEIPSGTDPTATTTPGVLPEPGTGVIPTIEEGAPGEFPSAVARGGITETTIVVDTPVRGVNLSGTQVTLYEEFSGKFYTLSPNGDLVSLTSDSFPGVQTVEWHPDASSAILEFPDGANIYYDFTSDTQVTLPRHWTDFTFSPSGSEIVFKSLAQEPENNFLAVADPTGNGARTVAHLGRNSSRVHPDWSPNSQIVASYTEPLDGSRQELFFLGLNDENFRKITVNGYNFEGMWNPEGTQMLYSVSSPSTNDNPTLWIVNAVGDAIGSGRRPLNLQTTADKCVFYNTQTAYCAVPQFLPEGSGILPSITYGIPDDIYKIDVTTGLSSKIAELDRPMTLSSLTVSADERTLYFTDSLTDRLSSIRLR